MACPLRFVMVGVSLVVALCLAWFAYEQGSDQADRREGGPEGRPGKGRSKIECPTLRQGAWLLLDMFTGKYLYQIVRGSSTSGGKIKGI